MPGSIAAAVPRAGPVQRPSAASTGPAGASAVGAGAKAGMGAVAATGAGRLLLQAERPSASDAPRTATRILSPVIDRPSFQRFLEHPLRVGPEGLPRTVAGVEHVPAAVNLKA